MQQRTIPPSLRPNDLPGFGAIKKDILRVHFVTANCYHRTTCRLCESENVELVVDLAPIPLAEKYVTANELATPEQLYPIDLYMCRDCGHVQILDVIDPALLWNDYTYHSGQTRGIVEHFERIAERVVNRFTPPAGSLVVDIGSNDGSLLRPFQQRGFGVLGIDPAVEIARRATDSGIETIPALLSVELATKIHRQRGPASIVTAFNVFAHSDDMAGMVAAIRRLLAPKGVFLFEVQYLLDILDRMLLGTVFHEHLCHHSLTPLLSFLNRHGLEVIDVERVGIQKGSIIGTVQHIGGPHATSPSVTKLLDLERQRRIDDPETVRGFGQKLQQLKDDAGALVAEWKGRGKTIAGYGAARSGPTLVAQLGLEDVIEFVVDDHPQKVNKFTPGHHIPVLPTAELLTRQPDYVIILAWIHAKKIIANNRAYLDQGGHFVVCCPEVRVIGREDVGLGER